MDQRHTNYFTPISTHTLNCIALVVAPYLLFFLACAHVAVNRMPIGFLENIGCYCMVLKL